MASGARVGAALGIGSTKVFRGTDPEAEREGEGMGDWAGALAKTSERATAYAIGRSFFVVMGMGYEVWFDVSVEISGGQRPPLQRKGALARSRVGRSERGAPRLDRDPLPSAVALKRMVTVKALRQAASEHRIG